MTVNTAFFLAVGNIAAEHGKPLPKGQLTSKVEGWDLTLNNSPDTVDNIPPFNVKAAHDTYFAFAMFGPDGGLVGGATEDDFITAMARAFELRGEEVPA